MSSSNQLDQQQELVEEEPDDTAITAATTTEEEPAEEEEVRSLADDDEEVGQEALWIEEEASGTMSPLSSVGSNGSPGRKGFFGGGSSGKKKQPHSPSRRQRRLQKRQSKKKRHHVLLLGEPSSDDSDGGGTAGSAGGGEGVDALSTEPPVVSPPAAAADTNSPEFRAATKILTARQMLDQSLACSTGSQRMLARAAFGQACEARRLLTPPTLADNDDDDDTMNQVLQDAVQKGVAAVVSSDDAEPDRAKQLLEFILPALDERHLCAAAAALASNENNNSDSLPKNGTFDSNTVSSLGFDKQSSFDCKSPRRNNGELDVLSMSSLNEILDGPLSPAHVKDVPKEISANKKKPRGGVLAPTVEEEKDEETEQTSRSTAAAVAVVDTAAAHSKKGLFQRFKGGKNATHKSNVGGANDIQRFSATVIVEDGFDDVPMGQPGMVLNKTKNAEDGDDDDDSDNLALETDQRINALLQGAIEDDDTCSLHSLDGVPVYTTEKSKDAQQIEEKIAKALSWSEGEDASADPQPRRKPTKFDQVQPSFVAAPRADPASILGHASLDSLQAAGMIDEDDGMIPVPPVPTRLRSASKEAADQEELDRALTDEDLERAAAEEDPSYLADIEQLPSTSPLSGGAESVDKYTVVGEAGDVTEDKYSVLPDPCSFCESFSWMGSKEEEEEVAVLEAAAAPDAALMTKSMSEPPTDKYAELPPADDDVQEPTEESEGVSTAKAVEASSETKTTPKRRSMVAGIFGKLKRSSKNVVVVEEAEPPVEDAVVAAAEPSNGDSLSNEKSVVTPTRSLVRGRSKKMTPKKSILKEKSKASQNMTPSSDKNTAPEEPAMFKISVVDNSQEAAVAASSVGGAAATAKTAAEPDAYATEEGSSGSEHDPWVDYIKTSSSNMQQQRGMDPESAAEVLDRPVRLDP